MGLFLNENQIDYFGIDNRICICTYTHLFYTYNIHYRCIYLFSVLRGPNNRFIIDGEQVVSPNTTYLFTYQNNFFEYRRDNGSLETITTRGFLSRAVDLMV